MENNNQGDKILENLSSDFKVVGTKNIHGWYVWAAAGLLIGALATVAYVSNQSGRFGAGRAAISEPELPGMIADESQAELRFISPENNSEGDTNPVLVVESMHNGEPSVLPVYFSIARVGSDDFVPLAGSYDIGTYDPGRFIFIPSVFSNSLDPNTEPGEPAKLYEALPAGEYIIRVTRAAEEEPETEDFKAQVFTKPILKPVIIKPTATLKFTFLPGAYDASKSSWNTPCGCENIQLEVTGPTDPKFKPVDGSGTPVLNLGAYANEYKILKSKTTPPGDYIAAGFAFQIKAKLTEGSNPDFCQEGQKAQGNHIYKVGRDDYVAANDLSVATTFVQPNAYGGYPKGSVGSTEASRKQMTAATGIKDFVLCPLGGAEWCDDDYHVPSIEKKYHGTETNRTVLNLMTIETTEKIIKWFDAPGFSAAKKSDLPLHFEGNFVHEVRGNNEFAPIIEGEYGPTSLAAGKTCQCKSHVVFDVDKEGKVTAKTTSDCDATIGGKDGKVEDAQRLSRNNGIIR